MADEMMLQFDQLRIEYAHYMRVLRRHKIVTQWHQEVFDKLRRSVPSANFKFTDFALIATASGLTSQEGISVLFAHLLSETHHIVRRAGKYPTYRVN
jgi:hypothetical protein